MKKLIKHLADHIESDPWDEVLEKSDRWLIKFCWGVIIIAILYFGGIIIKMWIEGRL
jgi:hypothetical protein